MRCDQRLARLLRLLLVTERVLDDSLTHLLIGLIAVFFKLDQRLRKPAFEQIKLRERQVNVIDGTIASNLDSCVNAP